ncbi:hypothetical protein GGR58DRAFT_243396 [Xylaria digitata]|nr:hypothetical protein GGR58DRAFT_243396 [Xylaria digitata]
MPSPGMRLGLPVSRVRSGFCFFFSLLSTKRASHTVLYRIFDKIHRSLNQIDSVMGSHTIRITADSPRSKGSPGSPTLSLTTVHIIWCLDARCSSCISRVNRLSTIHDSTIA